MERVYQENESKQTLLGDTAEITDSNESKYLLRARREQEGAFSHQTNKHKHRYTHTFYPALALLLEDLIKRRSAFVCPPLGSDFTNLPSQLHCPALHTHTHTDFQTQEQTHACSPVCALSTGLQIPPQTNHSNTADLLLAFSTDQKKESDRGVVLPAFISL